MELDKVHNSDAIKGLSEMPSYSVDLIITDPPYNITDNEWDKFQDSEFMLFTEIWMNECHRLSRGKFMLMFWSQQKLNLIYDLHTKWRLKRIIIWNMPNAPIHNQDGLIFTWQPCILLEKDGEPVINNGNGAISSDVLVHNFRERERFGHPTIKPLNLIKQLVEKYSKEGDIILDPFMGSGTTAVACKILNRRFTGYELDPVYYEIINDRLMNTSKNRKLNEWGEQSGNGMGVSGEQTQLENQL